PFGKPGRFGTGEQFFGAFGAFPARQCFDAHYLAAGGLDLRLEAKLDPVAADRLLECTDAQRQGGRRNLAIRHPPAPEPAPSKPLTHLLDLRLALTPNQGASRARVLSGQWRFSRKSVF